MTQQELDQKLAELRIEWKKAGRLKRVYIKRQADDLIDEFKGIKKEVKTERKEEYELDQAVKDWENITKGQTNA